MPLGKLEDSLSVFFAHFVIVRIDVFRSIIDLVVLFGANGGSRPFMDPAIPFLHKGHILGSTKLVTVLPFIKATP